MENIKKLNGKSIGLLGFGIENQALFAWLVKHGVKKITICDKNLKIRTKISKPQLKSKNFKYRLGKDYLKNLDDFDVVFRTPGISPLVPELVDAKKKGVEISSQIKLFMDLCPAKTIGITGTKGKGTTSTLIYEILKKSLVASRQSHVYLGGNIGTPPIEFLDKLTKNDWVVLELSSFQLMDLEKSPNIAVILDIKTDHLDYHKNQAEYIHAKENIVRYQNKQDFVVVNLDYLTSFDFASISPTDNDYYFSRRKSVDQGCYVEWTERKQGANFGRIILGTPEKDFEITKTHDITLRGEHNLENITAAITAGYLAGASIEAIKRVVPKFPGLEHRLEYVGEADGVKFYNDSFSTTPDTAIAAIKSFGEPVILISGGSEKGADFSLLGKEIAKNTVKVLIAIGITGPKIVKAISKKPKIILNCKNMKEVIKTANKEARSGDIVLLSPASASFDMFKNYKDRGNQFKEEVRKLI